MRITSDDPGRRLVLEGSHAPRWFEIAGRLLASRGPTLLGFERDEIRIEEPRLLAAAREESHASHRVVGVQIRGRRRASSATAVLELRLSLWIADAADGRPDKRVFKIDVEGLDRREEVADLALRLANAVGLPFYRIVRNEKSEIEVAVSRAQETGMLAVPPLDVRADYAANVIAPSARSGAAVERLPPFDPLGFESSTKVTAWDPGREVRFEKPASAGMVCAPGVTLILAGPAAVMWVSHFPIPLSQRVTLSAIFGASGLLLGWLSAAIVFVSLPRRVVLDWRSNQLTIITFRGGRAIAFSDIVAIRLKTAWREELSTSSRSSRTLYWCQVVACLRARAKGNATEVLIETECHADRDTPYRVALPLVTELAKALNVERRLT